MVTLAIDRLHARYVVDQLWVADRFDACLRRVVAEELDRELQDCVPPAADHVCVAGFTVPVSLAADSGLVPAARTWAREIVAALERTIRDGIGVVVYPRTLDALVDLVVSVGRGDTRRAWAWRQVGLVHGGGSVGAGLVGAREAVVAALVAHAELAPAVLAAAAVRGRLPLTAGGWVAVARAVQDLLAVGPQIRRPRDPSGGDGDAPALGASPGGHLRAGSPTAVRAIVGAAVARQLPDVDLVPQDRRVLARLAVLCAAPSLARSEAVVDAVASALVPREAARLPAAAAGLLDRASSAGADGSRQVRATRPGGAAEQASAATGPAADVGRPAGGVELPADPGEISAAGGVLFLVRIVTDLELVAETGSPGAPLADRPFPWIVSSLAVRLTAASPDDPAISALAGPLADDAVTGPPTDAEDAALTDLTERVEAWLCLQLRLGAGDDLDWLWRRQATIVAEPGWIEATFALDDVDTRVRLAGLDLDPGFVWWLGAVVRFRYV
ncbi:MAG: hypothetical protein ACRDRR_00370 [Pseudonocardiaceae bacterium]